DPAISRHLAAFLARHAGAAAAALGGDYDPDVPPLPDALLLNGGVFNAPLLAQRLVEILAHWRGGAAPRLLDNPDPDLAVARGAVAYARARAGQGMRIAGGSARSYVLLLKGDGPEARQGVCLLPKGSEEAVEVLLPQRSFALRLGQPVAFHLASSTGDEPLQPGQLLPIDYEQFMALPPMATVLGREGGGEVRVQLIAQLTEVGTLALACVAENDSTRRWALEFQLRGSAGEAAAPADRPHPRIFDAAERIERAFGARIKGAGPREVKQLRADLEKILGRRDGWDTPLLRELYGQLWEGVKRRRRSADHERVWLSLVGFCLRPGFGAPLDDWRLEQLWSLYDQGVQYGNDGQVLSEWWTLWRRVAGGLPAAAQERILADLVPSLPPQPKKGKAPKALDDMIRLAAVLERLPIERKVAVGDWLLERLAHKGESPHTWWAVGRLGVRVPLYGSAHNVVPREAVARWLEVLLQEDWPRVQQVPFAAALLARLSGDRQRDLDSVLRQRVAERLKDARAPAGWVRMVEEVVELDEADEKRIYGESLPPGLRLVG
ncbi:MAG: molecular chaperone DnaK, partial [Candidatus Competibacteraceae bacterium]|nr:molecular chaperone DnaK [Candidatus Competibacteraceae bacterium]